MIHPALRDFFDRLARHPAFVELLAAVRGAQPGKVNLSGLTAAAQAIYIVLLQKQTDRPVVLLVDTNSAAETLHETVSALFEQLPSSSGRGAPCVLPAHDVTPFDGLSPHAEIGEKRGIALWRMAEGTASIVIAPIAAALLKTAPGDFYKHLTWQIEVGDEFFLEDLESGLVSAGYARQEPVEMVGQFSVRGGILDVFSPEAPYPVRIELFGDRVESIREFAPETQRSLRSPDEALLLPLSDYPAAAGENGPAAGWEFSAASGKARAHCLLDMLSGAILIWNEPDALRQEAGKLWERLEQAAARAAGEAGAYYLGFDRLRSAAERCDQVILDRLGIDPWEIGGEDGSLRIRSQAAPRFQSNVAHCMRELKARVSEGSRALVTAGSLGDLERLADIFNEFGIPYQLGLQERPRGMSPYLEERSYLAGPVAAVVLIQAAVAEGCVLPDSQAAVYGAEDIFGRSELVAKPRRQAGAAAVFLSDLEDLKEGDYVVHSQHGIGRFLGLRRIEHSGRADDFMLLEYAESSKLYVPLSRLDLVQKYHGSGGPKPQLDRLGGRTWEKTKSRVKARLRDMAEELLKLYARRKLTKGFVFSPDSNWQREFEDAFPYKPTRDQAAAARDVKRDMESEQAMDRLICGDVGFGKTEVAMRAAFKALGDDKQVAVLTPTTVLSFQHYETFRQRFAAFPVEIEMLNRFRRPKEQKAIVERVQAGKIDILIGTHRILSKDVAFSDLGLLIVDEEQRFGVRHKERLKHIRKNVDVLTLTATPIPRTLHMSLAGLRDISIIQTPPKDRLAIQTVVAPYSDRVVHAAIRRETARGGQVYYIHNRVESIYATASALQEALPEARIAVGHGQMGEKELERSMLGFMQHEFDVLVATTIVENGLDIPAANTIVVERSDLYGLSALYQLRGRVGRSNRRAYAYLLVPPNRELTEIARKRLATLKEFSDLGSGFKVAALDLELRGAGNLLGGEQSGQIAAIGFETYMQLLDEEVKKLKGEKVEAPVRANLKLQLDVHIPTDYIADETQRLQAYKRLAEVGGEEERDAAANELKDRYGPLPAAVRNLLDYSLLKSRAEALRIASIERQANRLTMRFREDSKIDPRSLMRFVAAKKGTSFSPDGRFEWTGFDYNEVETLERVKGLLKRLAA